MSENQRLLKETIAKISPVRTDFLERAKNRMDNLTKPRGSLGKLEELAQKICSITGKDSPVIHHKVVFVLAGDHGVTKEGVSAYPSEVTPQMVLNFLRGGAAINVLSRFAGARVAVVDVGVAYDFSPTDGLVFRKVRKGTSNFAQGPAMSREEAVQSVVTGIRLVEEEMKNGADMVATGDMGIGNTAASSAITAVMTGKPVAQVTGRGAGLEENALKQKVRIIEKAIRVNKPDANDALDVLCKVGGFEIGGLAGVILGGACHKIPVMLDGFISGAAALIAASLSPHAKNYMVASHHSAEPGHAAVLSFLGFSPLLDLHLRLGEGTGAVLGMMLAEASCRVLNEMATFQEAGVSDKNEPNSNSHVGNKAKLIEL